MVLQHMQLHHPTICNTRGSSTADLKSSAVQTQQTPVAQSGVSKQAAEGSKQEEPMLCPALGVIHGHNEQSSPTTFGLKVGSTVSGCIQEVKQSLAAGSGDTAAALVDRPGWKQLVDACRGNIALTHVLIGHCFTLLHKLRGSDTAEQAAVACVCVHLCRGIGQYAVEAVTSTLNHPELGTILGHIVAVVQEDAAMALQIPLLQLAEALACCSSTFCLTAATWRPLMGQMLCAAWTLMNTSISKDGNPVETLLLSVLSYVLNSPAAADKAVQYITSRLACGTPGERAAAAYVLQHLATPSQAAQQALLESFDKITDHLLMLLKPCRINPVVSTERMIAAAGAMLEVARLDPPRAYHKLAAHPFSVSDLVSMLQPASPAGPDGQRAAAQLLAEALCLGENSLESSTSLTSNPLLTVFDSMPDGIRSLGIMLRNVEPMRLGLSAVARLAVLWIQGTENHCRQQRQMVNAPGLLHQLVSMLPDEDVGPDCLNIICLLAEGSWATVHRRLASADCILPIIHLLDSPPAASAAALAVAWISETCSADVLGCITAATGVLDSLAGLMWPEEPAAGHAAQALTVLASTPLGLKHISLSEVCLHKLGLLLLRPAASCFSGQQAARKGRIQGSQADNAHVAVYLSNVSESILLQVALKHPGSRQVLEQVPGALSNMAATLLANMQRQPDWMQLHAAWPALQLALHNWMQTAAAAGLAACAAEDDQGSCLGEAAAVAMPVAAQQPQQQRPTYPSILITDLEHFVEAPPPAVWQQQDSAPALPPVRISDLLLEEGDIDAGGSVSSQGDVLQPHGAGAGRSRTAPAIPDAADGNPCRTARHAQGHSSTPSHPPPWPPPPPSCSEVCVSTAFTADVGCADWQPAATATAATAAITASGTPFTTAKDAAAAAAGRAGCDPAFAEATAAPAFTVPVGAIEALRVRAAAQADDDESLIYAEGRHTEAAAAGAMSLMKIDEAAADVAEVPSPQGVPQRRQSTGWNMKFSSATAALTPTAFACAAAAVANSDHTVLQMPNPLTPQHMEHGCPAAASQLAVEPGRGPSSACEPGCSFQAWLQQHIPCWLLEVQEQHGLGQSELDQGVRDEQQPASPSAISRKPASDPAAQDSMPTLIDASEVDCPTAIAAAATQAGHAAGALPATAAAAGGGAAVGAWAVAGCGSKHGTADHMDFKPQPGAAANHHGQAWQGSTEFHDYNTSMQHARQGLEHWQQWREQQQLQQQPVQEQPLEASLQSVEVAGGLDGAKRSLPFDTLPQPQQAEQPRHKRQWQQQGQEQSPSAALCIGHNTTPASPFVVPPASQQPCMVVLGRHATQADLQHVLLAPKPWLAVQPMQITQLVQEPKANGRHVGARVTLDRQLAQPAHMAAEESSAPTVPLVAGSTAEDNNFSSSSSMPDGASRSAADHKAAAIQPSLAACGPELSRKLNAAAGEAASKAAHTTMAAAGPLVRLTAAAAEAAPLETNTADADALTEAAAAKAIAIAPAAAAEGTKEAAGVIATTAEAEATPMETKSPPAAAMQDKLQARLQQRQQLEVRLQPQMQQEQPQKMQQEESQQQQQEQEEVRHQQQEKQQQGASNSVDMRRMAELRLLQLRLRLQQHLPQEGIVTDRASKNARQRQVQPAGVEVAVQDKLQVQLQQQHHHGVGLQPQLQWEQQQEQPQQMEQEELQQQQQAGEEVQSQQQEQQQEQEQQHYQQGGPAPAALVSIKHELQHDTAVMTWQQQHYWQLAQQPFNSAELHRLHEHYLTPFVATRHQAGSTRSNRPRESIVQKAMNLPGGRVQHFYPQFAAKLMELRDSIPGLSAAGRGKINSKRRAGAADAADAPGVQQTAAAEQLLLALRCLREWEARQSSEPQPPMVLQCLAGERPSMLAAPAQQHSVAEGSRGTAARRRRSEPQTAARTSIDDDDDDDDGASDTGTSSGCGNDEDGDVQDVTHCQYPCIDLVALEAEQQQLQEFLASKEEVLLVQEVAARRSSRVTQLQRPTSDVEAQGSSHSRRNAIDAHQWGSGKQGTQNGARQLKAATKMKTEWGA